MKYNLDKFLLFKRSISVIGTRLRRYGLQACRTAIKNRYLRAKGLLRLAKFKDCHAMTPMFQRPLIDGLWDNANYWIRLSMISRALGLDLSKATGVLGTYSRARVEKAFKALGISNRADHGVHIVQKSAFLIEAKKRLSKINDPADLLELALPGGFPSQFFYDGVLKRQRRATVDLKDPELPSLLAEALSSIDIAEDIIARVNPDIVLLSHALDFTYGALAWAAIKRRITVIALYGDYGSARFIKISKREDLFSSPNRPLVADDKALVAQQVNALESAGALYLSARLDGQTDDVGAIYAFKQRAQKVNRLEICKRYNWDPSKPIIAVYAPNWFDYPHSNENMPFRDFMAWVEDLLVVASETPEVNWLFKAHPCDEWYGSINGVKLSDLVAISTNENIAIAEAGWNGTEILNAIDGLTTFHGTAGIEASYLGKPVLVPYAGWYGDLGFAIVAKGRDDYLQRLHMNWWDGHAPDNACQLARRFAGWYFCVPEWHGQYSFYDDANQDAIWWDLDSFFTNHSVELERDVMLMRDWLNSSTRYFHIFKMSIAQAYVPPKVRSTLNGDPRCRQISGVGN